MIASERYASTFISIETTVTSIAERQSMLGLCQYHFQNLLAQFDKGIELRFIDCKLNAAAAVMSLVNFTLQGRSH